MRNQSRGLPAAAVLAGGISRHGAHCSCRYCVEDEFGPQQRQVLPVIPMSHASAIVDVQPTLTIDDIEDVPPLAADDAISQAFNATRETIAQLEARSIEPMTDIAWSPAQQCRRVA